jgi:hypothetical protein
LFHVTCQIDALDRAQSDLKLWPGGRICQIVRPAFLEERITDVPIFAQAGCPGYFYVTDAFRNIVLEHGLTGFEFRQVWPRPDDAEERQKFLAKRLRKKRRKANHG